MAPTEESRVKAGAREEYYLGLGIYYYLEAQYLNMVD